MIDISLSRNRKVRVTSQTQVILDAHRADLRRNVRQIRILPAGGNIRVMSSLDAQIRIWRLLATGVFVDAGMIANEWRAVTTRDIRPSIGMALFRAVTPFGVLAAEYAIPLRPELGDDPRGRWHISFAARAQF